MQPSKNQRRKIKMLCFYSPMFRYRCIWQNLKSNFFKGRLEYDWEVLWLWCKSKEGTTSTLDKAVWNVTDEIKWISCRLFLKIVYLENSNEDLGWNLIIIGDGWESFAYSYSYIYMIVVTIKETNFLSNLNMKQL